MTAIQVIDEIKALDPQERVKMFDFLLEIESDERIRYAEDQSFDNAADRVVDQNADLMRKLAQ